MNMSAHKAIVRAIAADCRCAAVRARCAAFAGFASHTNPHSYPGPAQHCHRGLQARQIFSVTAAGGLLLTLSYPIDTLSHTGRGLVVERSLHWVGVHALVSLHQELHCRQQYCARARHTRRSQHTPATCTVRTFVADVRARDNELLTADHDDLLPKESLLGHEGRQASKEMTTRINHNSLFKRHSA